MSKKPGLSERRSESSAKKPAKRKRKVLSDVSDIGIKVKSKKERKKTKVKFARRCARLSILTHTISRKESERLEVSPEAERALYLTHTIVGVCVYYYERKILEWLGSNAPEGTPAWAAKRRIEMVVSAGETNKIVKENRKKAREAEEAAEDDPAPPEAGDIAPAEAVAEESDEELDPAQRAQEAARNIFNPFTSLDSKGDGAGVARLPADEKARRLSILRDLQRDPNLIERQDIKDEIFSGRRPPGWATKASEDRINKTEALWKAAGQNFTHSGLRVVEIGDKPGFLTRKDPADGFAKWMRKQVEKTVCVFSDPVRDLLYGSGWLEKNRMLRPEELLGFKSKDVEGMAELGQIAFAAAMVAISQNWTNRSNRRREKAKQDEQIASFSEKAKAGEWQAVKAYEVARGQQCALESGNAVDAYELGGHELKGWSRIRRLWITRLLDQQLPPATPDDLSAIRIRYFTENPESQGDHRLFEFLENQDNWFLWDGRAAPNPNDRYARDYDWIGEKSRFNRISRPLKGIGFTYHHPFLHPYFFSFKDASSPSTTGGLHMSLPQEFAFMPAKERKVTLSLIAGGPDLSSSCAVPVWAPLSIGKFDFPIGTSRQLLPFVKRDGHASGPLFPGISEEIRFDEDGEPILLTDGSWDRTVSEELRPALDALVAGDIQSATKALDCMNTCSAVVTQDIDRVRRFISTGWWYGGRAAKLGAAKLVISRGGLRAAWGALPPEIREAVDRPFISSVGRKIGSRLGLDTRIDMIGMTKFLVALLERRAFFEGRRDRRASLREKLTRPVFMSESLNRSKQTRAKLDASLMISMSVACVDRRFKINKDTVDFGAKHVVTGALPMTATASLMRFFECEADAGKPQRLLAIDLRTRVSAGYARLRLCRPGDGDGKPEVPVAGSTLNAAVECTGLMRLVGERGISVKLEAIEEFAKKAHAAISVHNEAAYWLNRVATGRAVAAFVPGVDDDEDEPHQGARRRRRAGATANRMFRLADQLAQSVQFEAGLRVMDDPSNPSIEVPSPRNDDDEYLSGQSFMDVLFRLFLMHEKHVVKSAMARLSWQFAHSRRSREMVDGELVGERAGHNKRRLSDYNGGLSIRKIAAIDEVWQVKKRFATRSILRKSAKARDRIGVTRNRRIQPGFAASIRRHIDRLKDDRLRKDVAKIIDLALGGPLCADMTRPNPKADVIVVEDLGRYRFRSDRPRSENRRLSKWCHRRLIEMLTEECKLHGIVLCGSTPGYTSRFSALDGSPGASCGFLTASQLTNSNWEAKCLRDERLRDAMVGSLVVDNEDGFYFVPVTGDEVNLIHSPRNAAVNVGVRFLSKPNPSALWLQSQPDGTWACVTRGQPMGLVFRSDANKVHFEETGARVEIETTKEVQRKVGPEPVATSDNTPASGASSKSKIKVFRDPTRTVFDGRWTAAAEFEAEVSRLVWKKLQACNIRSDGVSRIPATIRA